MTDRKVETALKKQMKAVGLTIVEASKNLGVPSTTLSNWLNGICKFPDEMKNALKRLITNKLKKIMAEVTV